MSDTSLKTLQVHFQDFLLTTTPEIRNAVATPHKGSSTQRLSVYGDGYFLRLLEVLGIEFPALKNFMGQTQFEKMAYAYLDAHPSQFFSVRYIGTQLPHFLASYAADRPYLRELALFEIALSNTLDAANAPIKTTQELGAIPPEQWGLMRFKLHPSVSILHLEWDIPNLYETASKKVRKKPVKKTVNVALWRKHITPFYFAMNENETKTLLQIERGETFADLCQSLAEVFPEDQAAQQAVTYLVNWIKDEMVSEINM